MNEKLQKKQLKLLLEKLVANENVLVVKSNNGSVVRAYGDDSTEEQLKAIGIELTPLKPAESWAAPGGSRFKIDLARIDALLGNETTQTILQKGSKTASYHGFD